MEELIGLLKLLPQGVSVTAVLVVTTLFLKHMREMQADHKATVENLTNKFIDHTDKAREETSEELRETRNYFGGQLESISQRFTQAVDGIKNELRHLADKVK